MDIRFKIPEPEQLAKLPENFQKAVLSLKPDQLYILRRALAGWV
jgi:hypothetical protein